MERNFFNENYKHLLKTSQNICSKNGTGDDPEELLHYSIEQLLINPKYEDIIQSGFATFWLIRTMTNSVFSNTSYYARNIRLQTTSLENDIEYEVEDLEGRELVLDTIEGILENISSKSIEGWYSVELFKLWVDKRNYNQISKDTGIDRKSITTAIKTCKILIIEELKNKNLYDNK